MSKRNGSTYFYGNPKKYLEALNRLEVLVAGNGVQKDKTALKKLIALCDFFGDWYKVFWERSRDQGAESRLLQGTSGLAAQLIRFAETNYTG